MIFKHFREGQSFLCILSGKEKRTGLIASPARLPKGSLRRKGGDSPWL